MNKSKLRKIVNKRKLEDSDSSDVSSDDDSSSGYEDVDVKKSIPGENNKDEEEQEEKDELVKKIEGSQILKRNQPPDIELDDPAAKVCFHPNKNIILLGTMEGNILTYVVYLKLYILIILFYSIIINFCICFHFFSLDIIIAMNQMNSQQQWKCIKIHVVIYK